MQSFLNELWLFWLDIYFEDVEDDFTKVMWYYAGGIIIMLASIFTDLFIKRTPEIFFIESLPEELEVKNDLHAQNQCEGEICELYLRAYNEKNK